MKFFKEKMTEYSDERLLSLYVETGVIDYFGELYRRYMPLVYGVCLRYLGNAEQAEDSVMEIFEELVPKIERYDIREFRTWVHSVARNHSLQQLRRKKIKVSLEFANPIMESDDFLHLLSEGKDEIKLKALSKCIEKLSEEQKKSIKLFFFEERSYAEISEIANYALNRVKSYIQNGRRNLKICIESALKES